MMQLQSLVAHHIHIPHATADRLLQAWQRCDAPQQQKQLAQRMGRIVQDVTKAQAEALPDKDPEVADGPNVVWATAQNRLHL